MFQVTSIPADISTRCRWVIEGTVQGVGFRPYAWRLAQTHGLTGFVQNHQGAVVIEAQGSPARLEAFADELLRQVPPLAVIRRAMRRTLESSPDGCDFRILPSLRADGTVESGAYDIAPDTAVCPLCRAELFAPANPRRGYGLINCIDCGPRYSILLAVPYDRANTTMGGFEMCPRCRGEYLNPADRRFHAQPISCPKCGPQLELVDPTGKPVGEDSIEGAVARLRAGQILAIKGLGGFHLAVRADDEAAVGRLRSLKKRDHKPFAIMCASLEQARGLVRLSPAAEQMLTSPACPIVLARRIEGAGIAPGVAPGVHRLGVMLPYTPIQHLLFGPDGKRLGPLVMTSGNQSDEPLVTANPEAVARLGGMCDAILWHDRPIERGVDDSVVIDTGDDAPIIIRRARGFVPRAIDLPAACASQGLCVGGELKNTIAVVRDGRAILGQHLGDLTHPTAFSNFKHAIDDLAALFDVKPRWLAHDAHPVYLSTQHGKKLAGQWGVPLIEVQHHHAHAAALMAEHGTEGPILAVVCDGVGYGADGTAWGGELLACDLVSYTRIASLVPLRLAGGDAAAKDTARCGLAMLFQAFGDEFENHALAVQMVPDAGRRAMLCRMIRQNVSCATSTGMGRFFDGMAAILGVCGFNRYEAEAGMALEAIAEQAMEASDHTARGQTGHWRMETDNSSLAGSLAAEDMAATSDEMFRIDLSGTVRWIVDRAGKLPAGELSGVFHQEVAEAWTEAACRAAERTGIKTVGLSGGVFCNALLSRRLATLLGERGLSVLRHRSVGPNDGSISLGQAAVASARIARGLVKAAQCGSETAIERGPAVSNGGV